MTSAPRSPSPTEQDPGRSRSPGPTSPRVATSSDRASGARLGWRLVYTGVPLILIALLFIVWQTATGFAPASGDPGAIGTRSGTSPAGKAVGAPGGTAKPAGPRPSASVTGHPQTPPPQNYGAFPSAANTGIPPGTRLVKQSIDYYKITRNGLVIDGWDFPGQVEINADNVTIRNSRIRCSDSCISLLGSHKGLHLSHDDIGHDSGWAGAPVGVAMGGDEDTPNAVSNNILEYLHIHNVGDGLRVDGNVTLRHSYIHALDMSTDGAHSDGVQTFGGSHALFLHNTIEGGNTSDFLIQGNSSNDWTIQGNLLLGRDAGPGGVTSFAIGFDSRACPKANCKFIDNTMNRTWESGYSYDAGPWNSGNWYGNRFLDNSEVADVPT
jgi:hypothetical protein